MKPLLLIAVLFMLHLVTKGQPNTEASTYYEYDALSNTVSLSNNIGSIIENYSYTAFGEAVITNANHVQITTSAFDNRFMFTGREFIQQLNMYDYRNRFYSPFTGRFMQTDLLDIQETDKNLYRYVMNSPFNNIDPMGLDSRDSWQQNSKGEWSHTWKTGGTCKTETFFSDGSYSYQEWGDDKSSSSWYNDASGNGYSQGWGPNGTNYYEYSYDAGSGYWNDEHTDRKKEKLKKEMEAIEDREKKYRKRNRGVSDSDPEIKNLNKQWKDRYQKYQELDQKWWGVRGY